MPARRRVVHVVRYVRAGRGSCAADRAADRADRAALQEAADGAADRPGNAAEDVAEQSAGVVVAGVVVTRHVAHLRPRLVAMSRSISSPAGSPPLVVISARSSRLFRRARTDRTLL